MKYYKKTLALILFFVMTIIYSMISVSALENDTINTEEILLSGQYVSETFNVDPYYALQVQQKEQLAKKYYQASVSGDMYLTNQYKTEFEQFSNPLLFQEKSMSRTSTIPDTSSLPDNWLISDLYQVPQQKSYWCGCAAAKSILDNLGVYKTQAELASDEWLKTEFYGSTPWYTTDGTTMSQFLMVTTLKEAQREAGMAPYAYTPAPLGAAGTNPLTVEECKAYVMSATSAFNDGYGVAACGTSRGTSGYTLPGYPSSSIGHWIVCRGYINRGGSMYIVDPAKSSVISWSGSISAYYTISSSLFRNFVSTRGIVW